MTQEGYFRYPTIHGDHVVFVSEDDLWSVPADGGVARRLTSNLGRVSLPSLSPDGAWLAFTGREEGQPEVYCMAALGGPAKRLTYLGTETRVVGWQPDGERITFATCTGEPSQRIFHLESVHLDGGEPERLPTGPAMSISYGPGGGRVIGRHTTDLARWKRYRGGLTGDIWIDERDDGEWRRLVDLQGNVALPLWIGDRVYFVSDHEGVGNLFSCLPSGEDLRRHTHHEDYYARHPATDGRRIVYHAGADLYLYDTETDTSSPIAVQFHSPRVERQRRFISAAKYLQSYDLHPEGHSVAVTTRGKPFTMANWEGAVIQHGEADGVRYKFASWLKDGERLVTTSDASGEETLEIHRADTSGEPDHLEGLDIGRVAALVASPESDHVAVVNHRHELVLVDLEARSTTVIDRSRFEQIQGLAWSPDGRWLAYGIPDTRQTTIIKLCRIETGETFPATLPVLHDVAPAFDPEGKYLYFLSYRDFDPVYDNLHFDLSFPWGMRPFLITLQRDLPSPFIPLPRAPGEKPGEDEDDGEDGGNGEDQAEDEDEEVHSDAEDGSDEDDADDAQDGGISDENGDRREPIQIDLDGMADRIVAFPVPSGRYGQIRGLKGKALFSSFPAEGALGNSWYPGGAPPAKGTIEVYDFAEQKGEDLIRKVTSFDVTPDGKTLIYRAGNRLRVIKAGEKPKGKRTGPSRESGWLDLGRIKVSVEPEAEWRQMYREAWRLQRDQFWTEDMSGVDWESVYERYLPLLRRVGTRSEFSDLLWEMQGELGTSHAYEFGGDYRPEPHYDQGLLGADLRYDPDTDSYVVTHVAWGDMWDERSSSPLARPGINVQPGGRLTAVGGRRVGRGVSPGELLVNQAGEEVQLTLAGPDGSEERTLTVKTLRSDTAARYRDWVAENRRRVHEATDGRVGYIHIPDMGPGGYAEFHRGFLTEVDRQGLIIDVRYNGGGHVSQLILEKLARRRLGYDIQRWGEPMPYPYEAVMGPMVAIANEAAGSDGDMFSYAFKLMKLGPLIGKRTWGGVVGISPGDSLVDGGITTQPAYSFWFEGVGYGLENYGAEPDIDVDIRPQDYVANRDPQLDKALEVIEQRLRENPPRIPEFGDKPSRALPRRTSEADDGRQ